MEGELLEEAADEAAVERGGWRSHVFLFKRCLSAEARAGTRSGIQNLQAVQKSSLCKNIERERERERDPSHL